MAQTHGDPGTGPAPRWLVALVRPELPTLAAEIITEIKRAVPEYGRATDGPYVQALRIGVERALSHFVDSLADPSTPRDRHDETYRRLGRFEAMEGRTLSSLQTAYRIGAQVAWRRVMKVAAERNLPAPVMGRLADELFSYINQLASLSLEGYVTARPDEEQQDHRRRLLHSLLREPPPSTQTVGNLARLAGWNVPDEVTLVALPVGPQPSPHTLHRDLLVDLSGDAPHLLVPGEVDAGRLRMLTSGWPDRRLAVGLTVPTVKAAESLRWARRALTVARTGALGDQRVIDSGEHLVTLWLLSDETVVDHLTRRLLAGVTELGGGQPERYLETLYAWLTTRGTAADLADRLNIHPQTVRYRMRRLEEVLGDKLGDADSRFAMEVVLRATRLLQEVEPAPPGDRGDSTPGTSPPLT
ncbi:helix-turn-helix domain-containing protein [Actinomadura harenae]|uniref:PucR family transcriptional regulator n=1 Tax=Actinomadura harenae TaxID=2483351 RepID=A0A3M2MCK6_9ACTN|nr:PucR family transcriptional regulator [Actinomadura harenae]RMI46633.1 PucR family transcriptional regulator [Actinomadura harenae]